MGFELSSRKVAKNAKVDVKGRQVNETTRQQDFQTCGLAVLLSRCLYIFIRRPLIVVRCLSAKTKRAFANAKAGRTLVFLYLIYIMYKDRDLKLLFDYFSCRCFVSDGHSQMINSRRQSFDVYFVCVFVSLKSFSA